jgi:uncharacterized protein YbaR (Trm112 family)
MGPIASAAFLCDGDWNPDQRIVVSIDKELLEILVCPLSKAKLVLDGEFLVSTDPVTRRRYRIDGGIPVMLIDESEELDEPAWRAVMARQ